MADFLEVHLPLAQVTENPIPAGLIEIGPVGNGLAFDLRVDVLEMHVGDAVHVLLHEIHWVEARIDGVPGVEADLEDGFVHLVQ